MQEPIDASHGPKEASYRGRQMNEGDRFLHSAGLPSVPTRICPQADLYEGSVESILVRKLGPVWRLSDVVRIFEIIGGPKRNYRMRGEWRKFGLGLTLLAEGFDFLLKSLQVPQSFTPYP